ncbi:MAG: aminotransferase class I/II-fold pyridoxal phosphate-dependent enzyme [Clostridiales bacterium]|nr:aminotransferase class I/II-fold pyridoxal phosphate-dependent enzyme [Clostridiales bacterium]
MYQHGGDIYSNTGKCDFSANINFCGMPERVRAAAHAAVDASVHYPDAACLELKRAIAGMDSISDRMVFCGNGAADVIFSLVRAAKPKQALLPVPSFSEYRRALESVGCKVAVHMLRSPGALRLCGEDRSLQHGEDKTRFQGRENLQLQEPEDFRLGEDILDEITPETDMIFLCNPNNPTGLLTDPDLTGRILKKCEETDTLLVTEECFLDLTAEPERFSAVPWVGESDHLFVLKAFTKSFAMPGLRLGYGLSCREGLLEQMERVSPPWRVSVPAQAAGVAAAKEGEFLRKSREMIAENRKTLEQELRKMGFQVWDSAANFVFFKGEPGLAEPLRQRGILIRDCGNFEGLSDGYYRIAVRSSEDNARLLHIMRHICPVQTGR